MKWVVWFVLALCAIGCSKPPDKSESDASKPTPTHTQQSTSTVVASGDCEVAINAIREIISSTPSGLGLDAAGNDSLTSSLSTLDAACAPATAEEFRTQELEPWLNNSVVTTTTSP